MTTVSRIKDASYYADNHVLARRWCEQAAKDGAIAAMSPTKAGEIDL